MDWSKFIAATLTLVSVQHANAQSTTESAKPIIHIVYMSGSDCAPCVAWRATELPKLQETDAFKSVTFTFVEKTVAASVPSRNFLPDDVKPFKEKLDVASGRNRGSPQIAVLVNGEVYDYFFLTRSVKRYEHMISAIQQGTDYPVKRCTRWDYGAFGKSCASAE